MKGKAYSMLLLLFPLLWGAGFEKTEEHTIASSIPGKGTWETIIDSSSFSSYKAFESKWNYLYPWGKDHNGSARMVAGSDNHQYVTLLPGGILRIRAVFLNKEVGKSAKPPHQKIKYYSGAIHARHQITVTDEYPVYEISGYFKAPVLKGTWPAFWITAVHSWPPEADILEYKGEAINWQNTFIVAGKAETIKTGIPDAHVNWHQYKAVLKKADKDNINIHYYIDGKPTGTHLCNFMNKPMWLIINLQMEGSSGSPGPREETDYFIKKVLVRRMHR